MVLARGSRICFISGGISVFHQEVTFMYMKYFS